MSLILAKILGIYFLAIGLAFFLRPERFKDVYRQIVNDQNALLLGATMAILGGAILISLHNVWIAGWPILITLLGWWSLIKGFGFLVYPEGVSYFNFLKDRSDIFYRAVSLGYALVGLFLTYKGFGM